MDIFIGPANTEEEYQWLRARYTAEEEPERDRLNLGCVAMAVGVLALAIIFGY